MESDVPPPWKIRANWLAALKVLLFGVPVIVLYGYLGTKALVHVCARVGRTSCDVSFIGYVIIAIFLARAIFQFFRPKNLPTDPR